jgi:5-methylcytosine-specific restriction endonuclease McrA
MGRNVASYKFALAKSLMELGERKETLIRLGDLAEPYSRHLCEHLKHSEKQITSPSSKFLDACKKFNLNEISQNKLTDVTVEIGFNDVIDAFHVVGNGDTPVRFYEDTRKENKGITLTDHFFELIGGSQFNNLPHEVESRWRLVETAWEMGLRADLIAHDYEQDGGLLYIPLGGMKRVNITSSRDALNGYQKGKCFYCFRDISVSSGDENIADVDHFFPHRLKEHGFRNLDGIWNLVLACKDCNGSGGKSDSVPKMKYLQRLNIRNNYLISSHHPLKDCLIRQTGRNERDREVFLVKYHKDSIDLLIHTWEPKEELDFEF